MTERGSEDGAAEIRLGDEQNALPEQSRRCLVLAGKQIRRAEEVEILLAPSGVEAHGVLDHRNRLQRPSRVGMNAAETVVSESVIRVEGHRDLCLGLRPIEVLLEDCGPRRDKSRKRFFRVLFDRLFRVPLGK